MLPQFKNTTNIGVGFGLVLQAAGRILSSNGSELLGALISIVGFVLFIWGCGQYAKGKGYSAWFGALGLLSIIGFGVLLIFPDKHKNPKGDA